MLVRTAVATTVLGVLAALAGALRGGSAAAYGALAGTVIVVGVFGFGTLTVNAVARLMPTAAVMFALLTYTLQVLAMGLVFAALSASGLLDDTISRGWLGGTVIAGTLGWLTVQVVLSTSRRIPIYDLPEHRPGLRDEESGSEPALAGRSTSDEGGE